MYTIWKQKTPSTMPGTDFVSRQEHLFPHCFDTLSISSFSFCFVLSENSFNKASRKMANARSLHRTNKLRFELPENLVPGLRKVQYRNQNHRCERSRDLHMCHRKPKTGHIPDWKTNKSQMRLELCMIVVVVIVFFWVGWGGRLLEMGVE